MRQQPVQLHNTIDDVRSHIPALKKCPVCTFYADPQFESLFCLFRKLEERVTHYYIDNVVPYPTNQRFYQSQYRQKSNSLSMTALSKKCTLVTCDRVVEVRTVILHDPNL